MKDQAQIVIVGGGIMGVSLLYHLAEEGCQDILLIEKGELTSGSTWHAAGLVTHFKGNPTIAELSHRGGEEFKAIERDDGQPIGWYLYLL